MSPVVDRSGRVIGQSSVGSVYTDDLAPDALRHYRSPRWRAIVVCNREPTIRWPKPAPGTPQALRQWGAFYNIACFAKSTRSSITVPSIDAETARIQRQRALDQRPRYFRVNE